MNRLLTLAARRYGAPAHKRRRHGIGDELADSEDPGDPSPRRQHGKVASVTSRNPVTTAFAIAEGYWGAVPCGGQIKLYANSPLVPGLDSSTDGWVTFGSSLGADNLGAAASTYTACTISLAHWRRASWSDMESDWGMFCLTVIHETGHLLGHPHSLVPRSVMAPVFTSAASVPAIRNATWLQGWRAPAAK